MVAQDVHGVLPVPAGAAVVLEAGLEAESHARINTQRLQSLDFCVFCFYKVFVGKQIGGKCHFVLDSVSNV